MKKYVAYLLTKWTNNYDYTMFEPIKVVDTLQKAADYFLEHQGGMAIFGIKANGEIDNVLTDDEYCIDYSKKNDEETYGEYCKFKAQHIKEIKKILGL